VNDFIVKPVEFDQFNIRVENLLRMVQANKRMRLMKEENREAIKRMREKINLDLHDHLGAQLIDLKFLTEELSEGESKPELVLKMSQYIDETISMLRQQMLYIEDWGVLSEDCIKGLNLVMLRRYSASSREFDFTVSPEAEAILKNSLHKNEVSLIELYGIINEIITNDLKYGEGASDWNIFMDGNDILLLMTASSIFDLQKRTGGRGTSNLTYRIARIKGKMRMGLVDNKFSIHIRLPGENFG